MLRHIKVPSSGNPLGWHYNALNRKDSLMKAPRWTDTRWKFFSVRYAYYLHVELGILNYYYNTVHGSYDIKAVYKHVVYNIKGMRKSSQRFMLFTQIIHGKITQQSLLVTSASLMALNQYIGIPPLKISDGRLCQFHKHNEIKGRKYPEFHIFIAIYYNQITVTMKYIDIKSKTVPVRPMRVQRGSRCTSSLIPNLSSRWRRRVSFTAWPF